MQRYGLTVQVFCIVEKKLLKKQIFIINRGVAADTPCFFICRNHYKMTIIAATAIVIIHIADIRVTIHPELEGCSDLLS